MRTETEYYIPHTIKARKALDIHDQNTRLFLRLHDWFSATLAGEIERLAERMDYASEVSLANHLSILELIDENAGILGKQASAARTTQELIFDKHNEMILLIKKVKSEQLAETQRIKFHARRKRLSEGFHRSLNELMVAIGFPPFTYEESLNWGVSPPEEGAQRRVALLPEEWRSNPIDPEAAGEMLNDLLRPDDK